MAKKRKRRSPGRCECGSGFFYVRCCKAIVEGETLAETADQLMRSRYTAYARGAIDHIVDTTDPDGAAFSPDTDAWRDRIQAFTDGFFFDGVVILDVMHDGDRAEVEFEAKLRDRETREDAGFVERSRFIRRDNHWLYVDGDLES